MEPGWSAHLWADVAAVVRGGDGAELSAAGCVEDAEPWIVAERDRRVDCDGVGGGGQCEERFAAEYVAGAAVGGAAVDGDCGVYGQPGDGHGDDARGAAGGGVCGDGAGMESREGAAGMGGAGRVCAVYDAARCGDCDRDAASAAVCADAMEWRTRGQGERCAAAGFVCCGRGGGAGRVQAVLSYGAAVEFLYEEPACV